MGFLGMDINTAEQTLKKMEMYRNLEYNGLSKIKSKLSGSYSFYSGNNHDSISSLALSITRKFDKIKKMHDRNAFVIRKNIVNYREGVKENIKKL